MTTVADTDMARSRFKLHSIQDVLNLPPLEWLVEDVLPVGGQAVLYGPSGEGKSFVALDMALAIASGQPCSLTTESKSSPPPRTARRGFGECKARSS